MIEIVLHRRVSHLLVRGRRSGERSVTDGKGKAPTAVALIWLGE
jgi:hypothetical protein